MTINPVADEETGGKRCKVLLDNNYINPDMVVVGEITENNVAIAHKGLIWFKIVSKGKLPMPAVHGWSQCHAK